MNLKEQQEYMGGVRERRNNVIIISNSGKLIISEKYEVSTITVSEPNTNFATFILYKMGPLDRLLLCLSSIYHLSFIYLYPFISYRFHSGSELNFTIF